MQDKGELFFYNLKAMYNCNQKTILIKVQYINLSLNLKLLSKNVKVIINIMNILYYTQTQQ